MPPWQACVSVKFSQRGQRRTTRSAAWRVPEHWVGDERILAGFTEAPPKMRLKRFSARKYCRADLNEPLDQSPTMLTKQQSIFSSKALM